MNSCVTLWCWIKLVLKERSTLSHCMAGLASVTRPPSLIPIRKPASSWPQGQGGYLTHGLRCRKVPEFVTYFHGLSHHELAGPTQQLLLPLRLYGGLGTWLCGEVCLGTLSFQASWWKARTMPLFSTHAPAWEQGAGKCKYQSHHTTISKHRHHSPGSTRPAGAGAASWPSPPPPPGGAAQTWCRPGARCPGRGCPRT